MTRPRAWGPRKIEASIQQKYAIRSIDSFPGIWEVITKGYFLSHG